VLELLGDLPALGHGLVLAGQQQGARDQRLAELGYVAFAWYFGGAALGQRKEIGKAREVVKVQEKEKDKDEGKKANLEEVYYGVGSCSNAGCHGGSPPMKWVKDAKSGKQLDLLARCTEANLWTKNDKHADAWNVLAKARGQTLAQLALAWVLRHPQMTSALIGASRVAQIEDAVGALCAPAFTAEELRSIDLSSGPAVA